MWENNNKVYLFKENYANYAEYRDDVRRYKENGWIVRNTTGGVVCFRFIHDYEVWKEQK